MEADLTTKLKNFAFTCEGRALKAEQKAERLEDKRLAMGAPGVQARRDQEAAVERKKAEIWRERAKVAGEGFLLVDTADPELTLGFSELIGCAHRECRTRFVQTLGEGGMERQGLTPEQKR